MKGKIKILMVVIVASFMLLSCAKEASVGGKKEIKGIISYTEGAAAGAEVFITYGATEASSNYDDVTVADASGNYKFDGLTVGEYYIDAVFVNELGIEFNTPGYLVVIEDKKGSLDVDITLD
jgi:hypothetical protein